MLLTSDEWYLGIPLGGDIVGDRLVIEQGTDIDSLMIQWGSMIPLAV
jgi:hypothetical protein